MLLLSCCLLLSPGAHAAGGAWHAAATGPALSNRGVMASSQPLIPGDATVSGGMTLIYWRFELNGPMPEGFQARLCADQRCVPLDGASGSTRGLSNIAAGEPLRFIFGIAGSGSLKTVLRVRSAEVMVNYE